jgi:hypothetical protein
MGSMMQKTRDPGEAVGEEETAAYDRQECLVRTAMSRAGTVGVVGRDESTLAMGSMS